MPGVQEAKENSWATGTNPDVHSIYLRMVEAAPGHEGHVANTAVPGGTASQLAGQAGEALNEVTQPALVIIQTIDGDIRCDGSDPQHVAAFGQSVTEALGVITDSSPGSRILIVSQFGRPANAAAALADDPQAVDAYRGDGMCDLFDPSGQINDDAIATLTGVIEAYEAEQARVCAEFSQCTTDDGAATTFADSLDFMAADYAHFNLAGQAAQAETLWPTVARVLGLGQAAVEIDGKFDVGGHSLYLRCTGTSSPTIIYFHGVIEERSTMPVSNAEGIRARIDDEYRFCAYDRRNVGRSDTVDAPQRPDDVLRDVENLLAAAGVDGPYVLLGASFGGIPAYLFANRHPDDVLGIVMLDAMFPDDLSLDHLWPEEERYVTLDEQDECCELERISHYKMLVAASEHIGNEPDIPLIYLASKTEGLTVDPDAPPEYLAVAPGVLQTFVDRFSPGSLREVDSPHFMEPVIPDQIADALRDVISTGTQGGPGEAHPDGRIVFGRITRADPVYGQVVALWAVDPDGGNIVQLNEGESAFPAWSPDGSRIAYTLRMPDGSVQIGTMAPDGSDVNVLTEGPGMRAWPSWAS